MKQKIILNKLKDKIQFVNLKSPIIKKTEKNEQKKN